MKHPLFQSIKLSIIFASALVFNTANIFCQGRLDISFGDSGKILSGFPARFRSMAIQNNKIVVTGMASDKIDAVTVRYTHNGDLDSSFGVNGLVYAGIGGSAMDVAIQNDDKILIAGDIYNRSNSSNAAFLLRYKKDGQPDESFGNNGSVILKAPLLYIGFSRIIIQDDGKILCAGFSIGDFLVARFNGDGSLDSSFGFKGLAYVDFNGTYDAFGDFILQPDGKIILLGNSEGVWPVFNQDFEMVRLLPNGKRDNTFGHNGKITFTDTSDYTCIAIQTNGRIIAGGTHFGENAVGIFRAFNSNGTPDKTFGKKGTVRLGKSTYVFDMELQPDNKIIAGGNFQIPGKPPSRFGLTRLNADGDIDSAFGNKGHTVTKISNIYAEAKHVLLRPDNKILLCGYSATEMYDHGAIAQYINDIETEAPGKQGFKAPEAFNGPVLIYPNPAKNYLMIDGLLSDQHTKLTVFDLTGNIKLKAVANSNSYNLNTASLTTGNYLLKIETNGEVVTKQFIKE